MNPEQRKELVDALAKTVAVQSVEPAEILDYLARREPAIERRGGGKEADIRADLFRLRANVKTRNLSGAVGRLENGRKETEGRGLSRPIGAEQPIDLAWLAAEVYPINCTHVAALSVVEN